MLSHIQNATRIESLAASPSVIDPDQIEIEKLDIQWDLIRAGLPIETLTIDKCEGVVVMRSYVSS
jgi:hypothetical protein